MAFNETNGRFVSGIGFPMRPRMVNQGALREQAKWFAQEARCAHFEVVHSTENEPQISQMDADSGLVIQPAKKRTYLKKRAGNDFRFAAPVLFVSTF